jgi:predicted NBD/HSP70 family sugar kinase
MNQRAALTMDIGGSHVTAAMVDLERRALIPASRANRAVDPHASADELLGQWAQAGLDALGACPDVQISHTGLGSGFIDDGQIICAGDTVPPEGQIWNVPFRDGISEDYAAGRVIVSAYRARVGVKLNAAQVARRALEGDADAKAVYAELGRNLAEIMAPWVARFQPDAMVVGGNVARSWELLREPLSAGLQPLICRPTKNFEGSSLLGGAVLSA